jgi:hypothetical protein
VPFAAPAMWPTCIVQQLRKQLPIGFVAEPRVHLGILMEIDVGALESDDAQRAGATRGNVSGGTATAAWTASLPTVEVETEPPDEYEYEVRIFDIERERQLVAEIDHWPAAADTAVVVGGFARHSA